MYIGYLRLFRTTRCNRDAG